MSMHTACRAFLPPLGAAALLLSLPGAAAAEGAQHATGDLLLLFELFLALLAIFLSPFLLNWLLQWLWKRIVMTVPPFGFASVLALLLAVLQTWIGWFVLPAFQTVFDSFGADLPTPTRLLMQYRAMLLLPLLAGVALLSWLHAHPRRERYFAWLAAGEVLLIVGYVLVLYLPIFKVGEVVTR